MNDCINNGKWISKQRIWSPNTLILGMTKGEKNIKDNRKRDHRVTVRYTQEELALLEQKISKTSLSRQQYLLQLSLGKQVKQTPQIDYYTLINHVNELITKANEIKVYVQKGDNNTQLFESFLNDFKQIITEFDQYVRVH